MSIGNVFRVRIAVLLALLGVSAFNVACTDREIITGAVAGTVGLLIGAAAGEGGGDDCYDCGRPRRRYHPAPVIVQQQNPCTYVQQQVITPYGYQYRWAYVCPGMSTSGSEDIGFKEVSSALKISEDSAEIYMALLYDMEKGELRPEFQNQGLTLYMISTLFDGTPTRRNGHVTPTFARIASVLKLSPAQLEDTVRRVAAEYSRQIKLAQEKSI